MSKFKKLMAVAAVLFAASSVFVACSDDDGGNMGLVSINSLQTTSTSATLYWTIVPNSNCDGYNVQILEGTRANKGTVVVNQDFENRTAKATFTGLQPNTAYVAITQAIPSASSGFSGADTYELEFMTAPIIQGITAGPVTYTSKTEEDKDGNEVTVYEGTVTASWNALSSNVGSYTVSLFIWQPTDPSKPASDKNPYTWTVVSSKSVGISVSSYTFSKMVKPDNKYRVGVRPTPGKGDWYPSGEFNYSETFTSPAAPAAAN